MAQEALFPMTGEENFDNTALAGVVTLNPPAGAKRVKISVEAGNVRFWESGSSPSDTAGHLMYAGGQYDLGPELGSIKITRVTSVAGLRVQASYFSINAP